MYLAFQISPMQLNWHLNIALKLTQPEVEVRTAGSGMTVAAIHLGY
jgi:hypothetical protein